MGGRADVVVIGAGLGGLAAAVGAALGGRRVLLLERDTAPGGYARCFQRGPYRFDASLHALNGLAPGGGMDAVYRRLGISDRLLLRRLDPLYVQRFPDRDVVAPADAFEYEAELIRHFPGDAAGIRSYLDEAWAVYADWRRLAEDDAAGRAISVDELPHAYPSLARVLGETWAQMIGRHVQDSRLVAVLAALWGYVGLPPEMASAVSGAVVAMSYGHHGAWYVEGGSGAIARALEEVLREHEGEVRYSHTATKIDVRDGRSVAVETADGWRVEADVVISDANAPATVRDLVGRAHFPADWVERTERSGTSFTTFNVYLGLARDVFAEHGLPHELFLMPGYDALTAGIASLTGDWAHVGLAVTDYTRVDPGCAPPGGAVVTISTGVAWDYADTWGTGGDLSGHHGNPDYLRIKERVADELVARVDAAIPGLADAIRFREAATPLTNFAYTANPCGAIVGYQNTPDDYRLGWLAHRVTTPIPNLFLAGAWTNFGGQNPAIESGLAAARAALDVRVPIA